MQWIKCSDKMPPLKKGMQTLSDDLLVFHVDHGIYPAFYNVLNDRWHCIIPEMNNRNIIPTHWMKCPDRPTE